MSISTWNHHIRETRASSRCVYAWGASSGQDPRCLICLILLFGIGGLLIGCDSNCSVPEPSAKGLQSAGAENSGGAEVLIPSSAPLGKLPAPRSSREPTHHLHFTEAHRELGFRFVFDNGASPQKLMLESTAGGAAWLDYDADGWWDIYCAQGGNPFQPRSERRSSQDQLFRNLGGKEFENVTAWIGIDDEDFGHGVAIGDFDDDGFDDVYVTNVGGPDRLYRNNGDGTFREVTGAAGIDNPFWGSSAAWYDLNGDGWLDLYVCNYVRYDPYHPIPCLDREGKPGICHPEEVEAEDNLCFFNQGDGTFREESRVRGLVAPQGKSLGVVVADFNGDQLADVFVANDVTANHLFVNLGDGQFEERGTALGCAMSGLGHFQASMGVALGDFDRNGFLDLYCTHFTKDSNTLYANYGASGFEDVTRKVDLHTPTLEYLGFGTVMVDFDANGYVELFIANGHIDDWRKRTGDMWYMPAQLFTYTGKKFVECSRVAGSYFDKQWLGRAVSTCDYDHDGDLDLLVIHQNDEAGLLRNDAQLGHYLQIRFRGQKSNRRGIGTRVWVQQGEERYYQELAGGTSYCTSHQPALFFGLGPNAAPCELKVRWPAGREQIITQVAADQILWIDEAEDQIP
ncbi:MAG: hypothetical protein KatS3mg114_0074 [Planctomycetaceae bacterium]|nr:MAG: hypothetical protein KatS3mg114_0074 [Planctomycetaceae bacterium]